MQKKKLIAKMFLGKIDSLGEGEEASSPNPTLDETLEGSGGLIIQVNDMGR